MKLRVECRTIAEYEAAIKAGNIAIIFNLHVEARESSHVVARGSSHVVARESSHVVARESSHVVARESSHVVAWGSSHVEAWGSSHVEAWGSSHVEARESSHVEARESSHVVARGSSHVEARGNVFIRLFSALKIEAAASVVVMAHGKAEKMTGGKRVKAIKPKTAKAWCVFYGVQVKAGIALLFKAVQDNFHSPHGANYAPGETPKASDWDKGEKECGGGLHFSPTPRHALSFFSDAKKFVACGVKLSKIVIHPDGSYPDKCKAPRVVTPCYEVDRDGNPVKGEA